MPSEQTHVPLTRVWRLLVSSERRSAVLVLLTLISGSVLETIGVALLLPFISAIDSPNHFADRIRSLPVKLPIPAIEPTTLVFLMAMVLFLFFVLKNIFLAWVVLQQSRFVFGAQSHLSARLLRAYMYAPWTLHLQRNPAELMRIINIDASTLFMNVVSSIIVLCSEGLVTTLLLGLLFVVAPATSLVALALLGSSSWLFYRAIQRRTGKLGREQLIARGEMIKWINQSLGGNKEIRVLGREAFFVKAYAARSDAAAGATVYLNLIGQLPRLYLETLIVAGVAIAVALAWFRHDMSGFLPMLTVFGAAAFRMLPASTRIVAMVANIRYHRPAVDVICNDFDVLGDAEAVACKGIPALAMALEESIELRSVTYRYPGAERDALHEVSLTIPRGSAVAVEGRSGAGKTTLVDLILGLLLPSSGEVGVDGRSIHDNLAGWQGNIGYVPQTIYLSDDSIRANVAFGVDAGEIDDDRVWRALRDAQLEDVILDLPEKLDATVGERGVRLSGGQRQRIGIARALYHEPQLLIFDEATASLDGTTEAEVTKVIGSLKGRKTIIVISHRAESVRHCDRRFHLAHGRLVDLAEVAL
jgi:ATP-binding cassette, subfamily B, bacterial PglK